MISERKTIHISRKDVLTIRTPEISEVEDVMRVYVQVCGETPFLSKGAEDLQDVDIEKEKKYIADAREDENHVYIGAYWNGKLVGMASLRRNQPFKSRHRAYIGISVLQEYTGMGIGTHLMQALIEEAKRLDVLQLELKVVETNYIAQGLYYRFGFKECGKIPNAFHIGEQFVGELMMVKDMRLD